MRLDQLQMYETILIDMLMILISFEQYSTLKYLIVGEEHLRLIVYP